ncbi:aminopeptidase [Siphonobacter sp. SORGH_AS_0500]|uniref:aminopeptidase n=1 Tax=Siphonobacter sp. SORGH_AS_0500 TaxID=1864824 RepID=UPI0028568720|nr:aminopeptidase [Siphonobacter sp. SORGH_AS_0500]MDR6196847.1 putative aminopeptidase [Siphonobacter sp. SORGH_AS_0500]
MKHIIKKIALSIGLLVLVVGIWQWDWVSYSYGQLSGGARVLLEAKPVSEVLQDSSVPDSIKSKLRFIEEIRQFAIDSLGLNDTPLYQSYYDQHNKPICYVLTVAEPYQVKAIEFSFPIIGSFTYKGFFDLQRAQKEEKLCSGYDTEISPVSAYSTLGYFNDPILSGMLSLPEGRLASLIMHEMTHATVFIKNQHEFNENLANFIGDYGAVRFLAQRFGTSSPVYQTYLQGKVFRDRYVQHFNRGKLSLDSLYATFLPQWSNQRKDQLKHQQIRYIIQQADTLYKGLTQVRRRSWKADELPNNAFFVGFATYNSRRNEFEIEFKEKFRGDFKRYLSYLKTKYDS